MKKFSLFLIVCLFAVSGCQKKIAPRDIVLDRDVCAKCAMQLSDPRFPAQAVHKTTGEQTVFEEMGCAVNWIMEHGKDNYFLFVIDLKSHEWLNAEDAVFVQGYLTPMSYGIAAIADPSGLEEGKTIISYDEAIKHITAVYAERMKK